jgi:hypothetical protein
MSVVVTSTSGELKRNDRLTGNDEVERSKRPAMCPLEDPLTNPDLT